MSDEIFKMLGVEPDEKFKICRYDGTEQELLIKNNLLVMSPDKTGRWVVTSGDILTDLLLDKHLIVREKDAPRTYRVYAVERHYPILVTTDEDLAQETREMQTGRVIVCEHRPYAKSEQEAAKIVEDFYRNGD